jgi:hypothetical protein
MRLFISDLLSILCFGEHTAETEIGDISHSVLNSPKDGIIDKLELRRR